MGAVYGIPNMKLDKEIVQRRVDLLAEEGVAFVTNTQIGKDVSGQRLLDEFDAIVLCTGATRPRDLPCSISSRGICIVGPPAPSSSMFSLLACACTRSRAATLRSSIR